MDIEAFCLAHFGLISVAAFAGAWGLAMLTTLVIAKAL